MNQNVNINNAWKDFQNYLNTKEINKQQKVAQYFNVNPDDFIEIRTEWNDHHSGPQLQEEFKVAKFVKDVYFTIFPDKEGEFYPSNWIIPTIEMYKKIREDRAKASKGKVKDAFKGLRTDIVVACILRCLLLRENIGIPVPFLLRIYNEALKRSQEKKVKSEITLEKFEQYRTDSRKGIRTSLYKALPNCYEDVPPELLVTFVAYSILRFERKTVLKIQRLASHTWSDGNGDFPDNTSPSMIATCALFTACVLTNMSVDYRIFGVSKHNIVQGYSRIINSKNPRVQTILKSLGDGSSPPLNVLQSPKRHKQTSVKVSRTRKGIR